MLIFCSWTWEFHKSVAAPGMCLSIVQHLWAPDRSLHMQPATSQAREGSHRTRTQGWHQAVTRFLLLCKTHYFPDSEKKWIITLLAYVRFILVALADVSCATNKTRQIYFESSCMYFCASEVFRLAQTTSVLHSKLAFTCWKGKAKR